jgi:hypothetical protein
MEMHMRQTGRLATLALLIGLAACSDAPTAPAAPEQPTVLRSGNDVFVMANGKVEHYRNGEMIASMGGGVLTSYVGDGAATLPTTGDASLLSYDAAGAPAMRRIGPQGEGLNLSVDWDMFYQDPIVCVKESGEAIAAGLTVVATGHTVIHLGGFTALTAGAASPALMAAGLAFTGASLLYATKLYTLKQCVDKARAEQYDY